MQYGAGYSIDSGKGMEVHITRHIDKDEYEKITKSIEYIAFHRRLKEIYLLVKFNAEQYLEFMRSLTTKAIRIPDRSDNNLVREGNRLLVNYLSSTSMFIDYGKRNLGDAVGTTAKDEFVKMTHNFYDNFVSYRFMALMRHYATHYGFPLHSYRESLINSSGIFATKSILLKFNGWKHARPDIEKMEESIALEPHIEFMNSCIKRLYDYCIYQIHPGIIDTLRAYPLLIG